LLVAQVAVFAISVGAAYTARAPAVALPDIAVLVERPGEIRAILAALQVTVVAVVADQIPTVVLTMQPAVGELGYSV